MLAFAPAAAVLGWAAAPAWTAPDSGGLSLTVLAVSHAVRPGGTIPVKITVANDLSTSISDVSVAAPADSDCRRIRLGTLEPGSSTSYRCSITAGQPGSVKASFSASGTAAGRTLRTTSTVPYKVAGYDYGYNTPSPSRSLKSESPSPSPSLPVTGGRGGDPTKLWLLAVGLLAAGGGLVAVGRRRRDLFRA